MSSLQGNLINIQAAGVPVGYTTTVNFGSGFVVSNISNVITVNFTGSIPTGAENYEAAYNPSSTTYNAVGNGADDQTQVQNCFNDAITVKNATVYLPILYYISRGISIPGSGFKLPQIASVDTSAYVITFAAGHGHLPGDPIMFQGMAPAGAIPGNVYFGNFGSSTTTSLYTDKALAIAGGSTGKLPLTTGVTTTGTISAGSRTLVVAAELGVQVGTNVTIGPLAGPIGGATGGFYVIGGVGSGTTSGLILNTTNTSSTQTGVLVTYSCWIDWKFFDGGLKVICAPGAGLKKHQTWNTSQSSALMNVAIGANVKINGVIFEGLGNFMVPQGTFGTIPLGGNVLTVPDATWARPGQPIVMGDFGVTCRVRSISGGAITLMANVPTTANYSVTPASIRGQISSGVIGLTGTGTGGTNTVTMSSCFGLCRGLAVTFDTISGTYVLNADPTISNPITGAGSIVLTTNLASSITNNLLVLASDAGDDGLRVSSVHNAEISNCTFRHCLDAGFREQTNVRDYQAATLLNPNGGVNTGEIRFVHNYVFNCYQTASTTNDYCHGGAATVHFEDNTFDALVGSVKFANRVPGGRDLWLLNNKIKSSYNHGFEIDSNKDVKIYGNSLANIYNQGIFMLSNNGPTNVSITGTTTASSSTVAVTSNTTFAVGMTGNLTGVDGSGNHYQQTYTVLTVPDSTHITVSPTPTANVSGALMSIFGLGMVGFAYDGLDIDHNIFDNCGQGSGTSSIRIGSDSYGDGFFFDYYGVKMTRNTFKNIPNTTGVVINVVNGSLVNPRIEGNDYQNCQANNLLKMTLRSSTTAGFVNGIKIAGNNFAMNNAGANAYAVSISGTIGVSSVQPTINDIDISDNVFSGTCNKGIVLENVSNVRIKNNRQNLIGGNFFLPNNTFGFGQMNNVTFANNDFETTATFGYSIAGMNGVYIINNRHTIATGSSTASISNSCSDVWYIGNHDVGGVANFNQVPVNTKSFGSSLRSEDGTAIPSTGTWNFGSTLNLTNQTAGGTQYLTSIGGTFGSPTGSPTATTDGSTNIVVFSSMAAIPKGVFLNLAGAWTGARQILSVDPIAKTGVVSGSVPTAVTAAAVTYVAPTFILRDSIVDGRVTFSNANYTALKTDTYIAQIGTMSAARPVTLPLSANVPPGHRIRIQDESGTATNINAIQTARSGSDLINGSSATRNDITTAFGGAEYSADGVSNWFKVG